MNKTEADNLGDHYLVEKALGGDAGAFGIIIKNTERLVSQIVFKMISDAEDRKDIAQDTYLKTFKRLSEFKFQSKLSTWVARICYNTCLDHLRKKKLFLAGNIISNEDDEAIDFESSEQNFPVNDPIIRRQLASILTDEIEKLSPVFKTLITLYHKEALSYEEIAQIISMPEGTVKNYLFRARKTLKNQLLKKYKKEDL
jgi:RNA polymerase sigma factor (sigma-70 family)